MEDHTIVSLVSIGAGVTVLGLGMVTGNMSEAVIGIAGAAIGIGAGVSIPIGAIKKENCP